MVLPSNTDASVTLTFRIRDSVSGGLRNIQSGLRGVSTGVRNTSTFLATNSAQFVTLGGVAVAAAGPLANLAVKFGIVNKEQGEILKTTVETGGALVAFATLLSTVALVVQNTGGGFAGLGVGIAAFAAKLIGATPVILAFTASALALGVALTAVIKEFKEVGSSADFLKNVTSKKLFGIPILTKEERGFLFGDEETGQLALGERIAGAKGGIRGSEFRESGGIRGRAGLIGGPTAADFRSGGGFGGSENPLIINQGTIITDEAGLRELERKLSPIRKQEQNIRGITK